MRKILILVWLLVPVGALAFHMGPGQKQMLLDNASVQIRQAEQFVADEKWAEAVEAYERALTMLPDDQLECQRKVRLEKAKAQMFAAQLPAASDDLKALVDELMEEKDPIKPAEASAFVNGQFPILPNVVDEARRLATRSLGTRNRIRASNLQAAC